MIAGFFGFCRQIIEVEIREYGGVTNLDCIGLRLLKSLSVPLAGSMAAPSLRSKAGEREVRSVEFFT